MLEMLKSFVLSSFFIFFALLGQAQAKISIHGAGATFPYPIYSKWFSEYAKANASVEFNYQSIGSGGGIQQLLNSTIDFGASDVPMNEEEEKKATTPILHVPTVMGAVSIVYNLPEIQGGETLKLTGELISKIYMGEVTKWNDPLITALNPKLKFPDKDLLAVHRSDGSGTTAVFTGFLGSVNVPWKKNVGVGKSVKWKSSVGSKGNEGVTGMVKQTTGSIGYVELAYAIQNKLSMAAIQNLEGVFQSPSIETISASADFLNKASDEKVSIVNAPGKKSYPISSITYLLIPLRLHKGEKLSGLKNFLFWALSDGQKLASDLHYAPLPDSLREKIKKKVEQL